LKKQPGKISKGTAGQAIELIFEVADPRTLADIVMAGERATAAGDSEPGDANGFDSAEILRERLCENAGSIPAISTKPEAR